MNASVSEIQRMEVIWEKVNSLNRFKKLIELAINKIVVCTFDDKSIEEMAIIVINNDEKIVAALKNILEKNKVQFQRIENAKFYKLSILLLIWRTGFILKKSEINILEKALAEAGTKINKIETEEIKT